MIILHAALFALPVALLAYLLFSEPRPARIDWDAIYSSHAKTFLSGPVGKPHDGLGAWMPRYGDHAEMQPTASVDPLRLYGMYRPFF